LNYLNKKFTQYIIPGSLLFVLLFRLPMANFRLSYELSATYLTIFLFSLYLFHKKYIIPALFLLLCAFASYYPVCTLTSINSLRIVTIGILFYFVITELKPKKNLILNVLCIVAIIHVIFLILQHFQIFDPYWFLGFKSNGSVTGLTANRNEASALIALCAPAFYRGKLSYFLPFLVMGILISQSFGGLLAVGLMVVYVFYQKGFKFQSICTLLAVLVMFAIYIHAPGIELRVKVWFAAIKFYFDENLITGFGLGHWEYVSRKYLSEVYEGGYFSRAHNTFIHSWFELGFGFLILLFFYVKKLFKVIKYDVIFKLAIIGIFISCSSNSAFRINYLNGLIILIWLSLIEAKRRKERC
jgi:hypothetical protein